MIIKLKPLKTNIKYILTFKLLDLVIEQMQYNDRSQVFLDDLLLRIAYTCKLEFDRYHIVFNCWLNLFSFLLYRIIGFGFGWSTLYMFCCIRCHIEKFWYRYFGFYFDCRWYRMLEPLRKLISQIQINVSCTFNWILRTVGNFLIDNCLVDSWALFPQRPQEYSFAPSFSGRVYFSRHSANVE